MNVRQTFITFISKTDDLKMLSNNVEAFMDAVTKHQNDGWQLFNMDNQQTNDTIIKIYFFRKIEQPEGENNEQTTTPTTGSESGERPSK